MKKEQLFHTAIVGAGASGLFCAGSFDASKIVLDANDKPARKVSVSGGGKCNFSNRKVSAADYLSQNKHFCKNALAAFKPQDFTTLLDEFHIPWQACENGQLFGQKAGDIVRFLVNRAKIHHTALALGVRVLDIEKEPGGFLLNTSNGPVRAAHVVLACGGLSFPALGAGPFGIKMARKFGLAVVEQHPVLCGLSFDKSLRGLGETLTGSSAEVVIRQGKKRFQGPLLFTHNGISGPAVLKMSLFWKPQEPVEIDFLPGKNAAEILAVHKNSTQTISGVFSSYLPNKMAKTLLSAYDGPLADATRMKLQEVARTLHHFTFFPSGTAGYTKAEATAGGIDTRTIDPTTMEVRSMPNLFVTGELLDVTGNLGGFNLHWAWASGFAAGQALKQRF